MRCPFKHFMAGESNARLERDGTIKFEINEHTLFTSNLSRPFYWKMLHELLYKIGIPHSFQITAPKKEKSMREAAYVVLNLNIK